MKRLLLFLFLLSGLAFSQTTITGRKDGYNCVQTVSTATTLTSFCAAVSPTMARYITDIEFGSSAAGSTAADSFPTLKVGTGTNCGSNTAVIWQHMTAANTTVVANLSTPIKVPAGYDVCFIMSTAGSKTVQIQGWVGAGNE